MRKTSKYILLTSLGFSLLVMSCGILRPYKDVELSQQQQDNLYRGQNAAGDTTTIANLKWQDIFTDSYLQGLIEEGLKNNFDLKNAVLQVAQAEAAFKQSRLALLPNLNLAPQVTHNKSSKAALNFPPTVNINLLTTTVQLGFTSNWELDVWGKLASARRAAKAGFWQTDATRRTVQTALIANIANMYFSLLALDKQLQITEQTIELRRKTAEAMKTLKESAIVTGAAVVQSEANLYAAEVSLPDIKQAIYELENSLSVLVGRTAGKIERNTFEQTTINKDISHGIPVQLLTHRPDVQAAELSFRRAFENTNVAKAQFYPSFTITSASAGISALTTKNLLSESIFYNIVAGLTQPVFNRGAIRANHKISLAQQEQAWNTFQKTLLTAGQEVSGALYAYVAGVEKQEARSRQVSALEKAVNFTTQLLEYSSTTNYTDVLTSEQSLLTAKLGLISDQLQQQQAIIELYRALGGGSQ